MPKPRRSTATSGRAADLLRGHLAYASTLGRDASSRLLKAARGLEAFDIELARETYLIAWFAATIVGHVSGENVLLEICRSVQALPRPSRAPDPLHLLLDGLVLLTTDGRVAATPVLKRAAAALTGISPDDVRRWGWASAVASSVVWDDERFLATSARNLQIVRDAGAFAELPQHVLSFGIGRMWIGDFSGVEAVMAETDSIEASTGRHSVYLLPALRALQGREAEASALIASVVEQAAPPEREDEATPAHWAAAVLYNGLAHYEKAKSAAVKATWNRFNTSFATWALAGTRRGSHTRRRHRSRPGCSRAAGRHDAAGWYRLRARDRGPMSSDTRRRRQGEGSLSGGHRAAGAAPAPSRPGPRPPPLWRVATS